MTSRQTNPDRELRPAGPGTLPPQPADRPGGAVQPARPTGRGIGSRFGAMATGAVMVVTLVFVLADPPPPARGQDGEAAETKDAGESQGKDLPDISDEELEKLLKFAQEKTAEIEKLRKEGKLPPELQNVEPSEAFRNQFINPRGARRPTATRPAARPTSGRTTTTRPNRFRSPPRGRPRNPPASSRPRGRRISRRSSATRSRARAGPCPTSTIRSAPPSVKLRPGRPRPRAGRPAAHALAVRGVPPPPSRQPRPRPLT